MVLIIEHLEIDKRFTRRVLPYKNVLAACATIDVARRFLQQMALDLTGDQISVAVYPDKLSIVENPVFTIGYKHYYYIEVPLYGDGLGESVFNLRRTLGSRWDNHLPYRYFDLGWFSSKEWIYKTREWQLGEAMVHFYDGLITNDLIQVRRTDGVICTEFIPSLSIWEIPLLK